MRHISLNFDGAVGRSRFEDKLAERISSARPAIFSITFGCSVVALIFFVSLLHPFQTSGDARTIRWIVLAMWGGAVVGMCIYRIYRRTGRSPRISCICFSFRS